MSVGIGLFEGVLAVALGLVDARGVDATGLAATQRRIPEAGHALVGPTRLAPAQAGVFGARHLDVTCTNSNRLNGTSL